ncbi:MAG: hypothetical protein HFACDABA_01851 [Anaerolineales bacterium]|nr:hypothetical protein [Anaerolineales bacterium]
MKKLIFPLYGFLVGAALSVFASILFAMIAIMLLFGFPIYDPSELLVMMGYAGLYSVMFAFLPGASGGAYLAHWLSVSERTASEVTRRGLLVGAIAGLITSLACIGFVFYGSVDWTVLGFTLLAMAIASVTSLLAARFLAKKKSKFIQPPAQHLTPDT